MSIFFTILLTVWVIATFIAKYLMINKVWLRKHEQEVADSVSLLAHFIELALLLPFLIISILQFEASNFSVQFIVFISHIFFIVVGFGVWINNGLKVKDKVARAFRIERREYKSLLKEITNPSGLNNIFKFLCLFAVIDKDLHEKEEVLLRNFADEYNLNYNLTMSDVQLMCKAHQHDSGIVIMKIIYAQIMKYLHTSPPKEIIIYLEDLIRKVIEADNIVTHDEEALSEEIIKNLQNYLLGEQDNQVKYNIILVPQNKEQEDAILATNINLKANRVKIYGSENAYMVDSYYSENFAELVRIKLISLYKCFVTIEKY